MRHGTPPQRSERTARAGRAGFSLAEMMVVIAIVLVLAGVSIVAVNKVRNTANAAASKTMLTSISMGLQQFKEDFGAYPPSEILSNEDFMNLGNNRWEGGEILAQMMAGPVDQGADGVDGPGYREYRPHNHSFADSGPTYGPYVSTNDDDSLVAYQNNRYVFSTTPRSSKITPVLYYRKQVSGHRGDLNSRAVQRRIWGSGSDQNAISMYNTDHNADLLNTLAGQGRNDVVNGYWAKSMSDGGPSDEKREAFETTLRAAEFLLIAPGPDTTYGTEDDVRATGP